jgi:hypothetical protein
LRAYRSAVEVLWGFHGVSKIVDVILMTAISIPSVQGGYAIVTQRSAQGIK